MTEKTFNSDYYQMAYVNSSDHQEPYHFYAGNSYGHYISDSSVGDESNFWSCSPRSDSPSPNAYVHSALNGPYSQNFKPLAYSTAEHQILAHRNGYAQITMSNIATNNNVPFVRVVKRRSTANKKERRRTQSINNAYADLRDCIPNVPADTKLSKIKTLRLATSYISYLTKALESDNPAGGFKAELASLCRKSNHHASVNDEQIVSSANDATEDMNNQKKAKGRTGWPQHVWALELKQEQTI